MERYRTTIILVVVLVALAALAFFLNRQNLNTAATPTPVPSRYVWEETDTVSGISVVSGTQSVKLQQDLTTTVWSLLEPVSDTADVFAVGNIADSLKNLQATAIFTGVTDLAQYGLDKPVMQVTVAYGSDGSKTHQFVTGNTTIDGSGYYVLADDKRDTVYVVTNGVIEPLKSWLTSPPKAQATATPLPLTVVPTATNTVPASPGVTGTVGITSTTGITTTAPGAANPTTPLTTPILPSPTTTP